MTPPTVTDTAIEMMLRERGRAMVPNGLENAIVVAVRAESARAGTRRRWLARAFRPTLAFALVALLLAALLAAIAIGSRKIVPLQIDSRVAVGDPVSPRWFTSDGQSLWVHELTGLVRVDMATSAITGQVPMYIQYGYATTGAGAVWETDFSHDVLLRIDPVADKVVASIPVGSAPEGVAVTAGAVWVADEHDGAVTRVDPATNTVVATIPIGSAASGGPQIMTAGPGGVWVDFPDMGAVVRIDPATNTVGTWVPLEGPVASDGTQVWIGGPNGLPEVVRIDPVSGKVITTVDLNTSGITYMAVGLGSVWVTADGALLRIDSATGRVVGHLDGVGGDVMVAGGAVWVTSDDQPYVLRILPCAADPSALTGLCVPPVARSADPHP